MSNHGEMSPEQSRHFEKMLAGLKTDLSLGPTRTFPKGKIHQSDKGELRLAIGHKDGKVFLHFGEPTDWIGFTKAQALALAETIIKHAAELEPKP